MDNVRRRITPFLAALALLALPGAALWAEPMRITFAKGALAVWPATSSLTVVVGQVAPQIKGVTESKVQPFQQAGLFGAVVPSTPKLGVRKVGQGWVVEAGAQPLPQASAVLLKNSWHLAGNKLHRATLNVAGNRWQVGLTMGPLRQGIATAGVVQRMGRSLDSAIAQATPTPILARNDALLEPAAGLQPTLTPSVTTAELENLLGDILLPNGLQRVLVSPSNLYAPGERVALPRPVPQLAAPLAPAVSPSLGLETVSASAPLSPSSPLVPRLPSPEPIARSQEATEGEVGVLIPPQGRSYLRDVQEALQAVADAPQGSSAAREASVALAGVYLAWQRPEEAQGVLATLPQRADGLPAQAVPRLLWGVADLARARLPQEGAFDQGGTLAPHAQLWAAVAANQRGAYSAAAQGWPTQRGILPNYPPYLRSMAQVAQVNALVMTGQHPQALKALQALANSGGKEFLELPALRRLAGLAKLGNNQVQEGLEDLAAAAENTTDPTTAARAKLEFVRTLHRRRELTDAQLRGHLRDLQQEWRGDETERQVLAELADLYEKAGEPNNALKAWQTLVQAFPQTTDMPLITNRMAQAFVTVFDPEASRTYDPLTYLGLYYDFRELLPNDERGDLVQERMAEALVKANLFGRAVPILEQQLQYRNLESVAQGRIVLLLARSYRQLARPEDTLKLLDTRRALATTQMLRRGWALEEARALAELNRPQAAEQVLKPLLAPDGLEDKEAEELAANVAWQGQNWASAAAGFQRLLAAVPASVLQTDAAAQLHAFRLAYALAQLNDAEALVALKARYQEAWPQLPQLADDINAVAASSGVPGVSPEGGPLQQLTSALSAINSLDDDIRRIRRDEQRLRTERAEYNRRMEYMELLPPPAL